MVRKNWWEYRFLCVRRKGLKGVNGVLGEFGRYVIFRGWRGVMFDGKGERGIGVYCVLEKRMSWRVKGVVKGFVFKYGVWDLWVSDDDVNWLKVV
jgi:hypothetical protein